MDEYLQYFEANNRTNYILSIRFPFYKNVSRGAELIFDNPFTVLVGPNGSGKSSVLQAIYGCPEDQNVSDFWFSTELDPILEGDKEPNRFIYKFIPLEGMESVEVIKTRAKRSKTTKQRADPDYWETSAPRRSDNMKAMPDIEDDHSGIRSKTRWSPIKKKVVYIDFRSELSAYDKFFYFGKFNQGSRLVTKQDFVRSRAKVLNKHISDFKGDRQSWYSCHTKVVTELKEEELIWINFILGKQYIKATYVEHTLFENDGYSILFKNKDSKYSEAAAGSGEVAIVNCVRRVLNAEEGSLILLDEPEVSLHPGAQLSLKKFLLSRIKENDLQVVMSSHSEHFIKDLPHSSIKLFIQSGFDGRYDILNNCSSEQAFMRLGAENEDQIRIYVEDVLAKHILEVALTEIDPKLEKKYSVIVYPGGCETILADLLVKFAVDRNSKDLIFLDGDKDPYCKPDLEYKALRADDIPASKYSKIDSILTTQTSINGNNYRLPLNGGNSSNTDQKVKLKLDILDAYQDHVHFLDCNTPEELIWKVVKNQPDSLIDFDAIKNRFTNKIYKNRIADYTKSQYGENETNGELIFNTQKLFLRNREKKHPLWLKHLETIKSVLRITTIPS